MVSTLSYWPSSAHQVLTQCEPLVPDSLTEFSFFVLTKYSGQPRDYNHMLVPANTGRHRSHIVRPSSFSTSFSGAKAGTKIRYLLPNLPIRGFKIIVVL